MFVEKFVGLRPETTKTGVVTESGAADSIALRFCFSTWS
jgi:hypothetical protein